MDIIGTLFLSIIPSFYHGPDHNLWTNMPIDRLQRLYADSEDLILTKILINGQFKESQVYAFDLPVGEEGDGMLELMLETFLQCCCLRILRSFSWILEAGLL